MHENLLTSRKASCLHKKKLAKRDTTIKNKTRQNKELKAQVEGHKSDVLAMDVENSELADELDITKELLAEAKASLLKKLNGKPFDFEVPYDPCTLLWVTVGKKGENFSQDMIELGLMLMGQQLSGEQAVGVLRAFLFKEYPNKKEGIDYRVPHVSNFKKFRRMLEPMCHFVGLGIMASSKRAHAMSDATKKKKIKILSFDVLCEKEDEHTGETIICHVPIKFEILTSGKAKNEAKVIKQSLHSSLLGGRTASLVNVVSSSTDNAAKATSRELAELKLAEIVEIKKCIDDQLTQYPERLIAARDAWLAMSPNNKNVLARCIF